MSPAQRSRKIRRIAELIRPFTTAVLATHVHPEGDAIGSLLGLALGLEQIGKRVVPVCADGVPEALRFLPSAQRVVTRIEDPPELAIAVDCDGLGRVGPQADLFGRAALLVDLDHHATQQAFGTAVVDPKAAAAGELVYQLLLALRVEITAAIATCLYTAILTDTGRFCYGNTTPRALAIASRLRAAGADSVVIYRHLYEERSPSSLRLLGEALSTMQISPDGKLIWATLSQQSFRRAGADPSESNGIVEYLRSVRGARMALLFTETGQGRIKVSMRSREGVDVGQFALRFNGGGHARAAGCQLEGELDRVRQMLLEEARRVLDS